MNCCDEHKHDDANKTNAMDEKNRLNKTEHKHKGHLSHLLMMVLCCGIPVLLLFSLPLLGSVIPGAQGTLSKVIPFLCPVMMFIMMGMMMKKDKDNDNENKHNGIDEVDGSHAE